MKQTLITVCALAVLAFCACGGPELDPTEAIQSGQSLSSLPNETAWAAGTNWTYETNFAGLPKAWVYRPAGFSQRVPGKRGVIFHLIGCGELPYQAAQGSGWPEAAEAYGLVIVIPEIIAPSYPNTAAPNVACYNFGSGPVSAPTRNSPDHKALIAAGQKIVTDYPTLQVDPNQVYLAGLSAGATVAMQVACMAPETFAGVASVAGPAIGADQSRAVMPPAVTSTQIRNQCTSFANGSSAANAQQLLGQQVYVLVSDDNGLPAGNPVMENGNWTADKFRKQTIWDGDKYVPHAYHDLIALALAPILNAQKAGTQVSLPFSGTGTGCPGGANSHDDTAETECTFSAAVPRSWTAKADSWNDAQGRTRILHIEQDTLRHRWPTGAAGPNDQQVTPNRQTLVSQGYILADGSFDIPKLNGAPNGVIGAVYFANDSFDFPMYLGQFLDANNPRIVTTPTGTNPVVSAQATLASNPPRAVISGNAAAQGGAKVASVKVTFQGSDTPAAIQSGQSSVSFSVELPVGGLAAGSHSATVTAVDSNNRSGTTSVTFQISGGNGSAPVIGNHTANVAGGSLSVTGTASDPDNDLSKVELSTNVPGTSKTLCTGTTSFTCTQGLTGVTPGTWSGTITATDAQGRTHQVTFSFTVPGGQPDKTCVTAKNSAHIWAGRAVYGGNPWFPNAYAKGSKDDLGAAHYWKNETTSVLEDSPGYWVKVASCP